MAFEVEANARYIPVSPRKVRLVLELIRGRPVREAAAILRHSPKSSARDVHKLVRSAMANAEANFGLDADDLVVAEVVADPGPLIKRGRFGARGRFKPLLKRTSHIRIGLSLREGGDEREPRSGLLTEA